MANINDFKANLAGGGARANQFQVTMTFPGYAAIGGETNSNLILLPNSPQAGSQMLNDMVASFTASNQIGEAMKKNKASEESKNNHPPDQSTESETSEDTDSSIL